MRRPIACLFFLVFILSAAAAESNIAPEAWWREGVVYQVYPRSFLDACSPACTGTGSLRGIQAKLAYLRETVGVRALWLSPIYDSPMADFGYDVSNFTSIWPTFGTMADFDALLSAAKAVGLRIILDFVPNHTSDQHPWFLSSRSSRDSPYRDWYIWHDDGPAPNSTAAQSQQRERDHQHERRQQEGAPSSNNEDARQQGPEPTRTTAHTQAQRANELSPAGTVPPNNWRTMFCRDAACRGWTYDNVTTQWYYHCFLMQQPDLNWRNPAVVAAMHDVLRFWLRRGVDGFRVDAFASILEDSELRDEPVDPDWHGDPVADGYSKLLHTRTENQPGLHEIVRGFRQVLDEFGPDRMMIGEIYADKVVSEADVISYYGSKDAPEFSMPFNMGLIALFAYTAPFDPTIPHNPRNATALQAFVDSYDRSLPSWAQPNYVLGNHDVRRLVTRLKNDTALARVATLLLLTLRGTPTIYNGDEIAQRDGYVPAGRRKDPNCLTNYDGLRCRDPQRTPLQWNTSNTNAGFSAAGVETWLPVSAEYVAINTADEMDNATSTLHFVSRVLALRAQEAALHRGAYASLVPDSVTPAGNVQGVFAFVRSNGTDTAYVIVANLNASPVTVNLSTALPRAQMQCAVVIDTRNAGAGTRTTSGTAAVPTTTTSTTSAASRSSHPTVSLQALSLQGSHAIVLQVVLTAAPERHETGWSRRRVVEVSAGGGVVLLMAVVVTALVLRRVRRRGRDRLGSAAESESLIIDPR